MTTDQCQHTSLHTVLSRFSHRALLFLSLIIIGAANLGAGVVLMGDTDTSPTLGNTSDSDVMGDPESGVWRLRPLLILRMIPVLSCVLGKSPSTPSSG